ncbi:cobalt ECF transporter T component CbiQ [Oculatella sp. LEGE 06141]|uniref:cobalt ECF transporter T component CbiQ n=1 Tax=Oculatella sp. LEGE 06141 TaxID=1828648 RepID=UPI001880512A|nr:cobalt ECF transporter T component CbiQ [Oculatella sp. LEGE 06141]MBE9182679.1 cobalt ECF transporter T component CbiQ [Oculatella sp. LEGE 06141]
MKLALDEYAHINSPIHRWETRSKLIGLITLIFAFAFVKTLHLLPAMLLVTALLYVASRLPLSFLLMRLRYPGYFLLGVVLLLPFLSGETVVWQWGALTLRQEGILATILITCRFLSIVTIGFILIGTTPILKLINAMRSLGLPPLLADMMLLSYRYLFEIANDLATMQQGMRLRGFRSQSRKGLFIPNGQELRRLASLTGTLLVRSYEQSERVYKAMKLRGYGAHSQPLLQSTAAFHLRWEREAGSVIALLLMLLVASGFVIAEVV